MTWIGGAISEARMHDGRLFKVGELLPEPRRGVGLGLPQDTEITALEITIDANGFPLTLQVILEDEQLDIFGIQDDVEWVRRPTSRRGWRKVGHGYAGSVVVRAGVEPGCELCDLGRVATVHGL